MKHTLPKAEKLKGKSSVSRHFKSKKGLFQYPIKIVYVSGDEQRLTFVLPKTLFVVPKRLFKKAVQRNRLKRLMREAYRLNKNLLAQPKEGIIGFANICSISFMYVGKEELPFHYIDKKMKKALLQLREKAWA